MLVNRECNMVNIIKGNFLQNRRALCVLKEGVTRMGLRLEDLDGGGLTNLMFEEFETDLQGGKLYISPRLRDKSQDTYVTSLREAMLTGNDQSLAHSILENNCLKSMMPRRTKTGHITMAKMRRDAHLTLAEGEVNRFYISALYRKAISEGREIEVYRAKQVRKPRPQSQALIGNLLDPSKLLEDLRQNIGVDTALGVPAGPNSGLSVRIRR